MSRTAKNGTMGWHYTSAKRNDLRSIQLVDISILPLDAQGFSHTSFGRMDVVMVQYLHPLADIYHGMMQRCFNPKHISYKNYGGRGITVCERWASDFWAFAQDIGERIPDMQLDRINNDGNYEPNNWKRSTRKQQRNNTRINHFVTAFGKTQTISQWAEETGIAKDTIRRRLEIYGWQPERALGQTAGFTDLNHILTVGNRSMRIAEWAREMGIQKSTIWRRIERGWNHRDAVTTPVGQRSRWGNAR